VRDVASDTRLGLHVGVIISGWGQSARHSGWQNRSIDPAIASMKLSTASNGEHLITRHIVAYL
jgi:hypothetical protein